MRLCVFYRVKVEASQRDSPKSSQSPKRVASLIVVRRVTYALKTARIPPSGKLLLWCGFGALLAGFLFLVWGYIDKPGIHGSYRIVVNVLAVMVPALFIAGFICLHLRVRDRGSWLGSMGVILVVAGAVWGTIKGFFHMEFKAPAHAIVSLQWVYLPSGWLELLSTGLILTGFTTVGTKTLWNPGTLSLAMGIFGWSYLLTDSGAIFEMRSIHVVFGILFALGWMALGIDTLIRARRLEDLRP